MLNLLWNRIEAFMCIKYTCLFLLYERTLSYYSSKPSERTLYMEQNELTDLSILSFLNLSDVYYANMAFYLVNDDCIKMRIMDLYFTTI